MNKSHHGLSLIELMIGLAVLSILLAIATPNFQSFLVKLRVEKEINLIQRQLLLTRNVSISSGYPTTFCNLNASNVCTENWHLQLTSFIDNNSNQRFEPELGERIILVKGAILERDKLVYGKGRKSIRFKPNGRLTGVSNGTFRYCPNGDDTLVQGVVIYWSGRTYVTFLNSKSDKHRSRHNKEISCFS